MKLKKLVSFALVLIFAFSGATGVFLVASERANSEHKRVIVVANADDPDSLAVAKHYMRARQIPGKNLVALPMPLKETISWDEFSEKVFSPLRREFVKRKLIDGTISDTVPVDDFGRVPLLFPSNFDPSKSKNCEKISYVVLCRGVPLRIANDVQKQRPLPPPSSPEAPPQKRSPFEVNNASVDSEIALLGAPSVSGNGAISNPFFKENLKKENPVAKLFLRVARLDGITVDDAKRLVDNALAAEKNGLLGRAYIDIGGPHAAGDKWLDACAEKCQELGFETEIERSRALMNLQDRYDAPALYFGWYQGSVGGFFLDPKFHFPAGAIAIHIHSFSATSMRSKTAWTPGLVARGVASTIGNVYEPYLGMSHQPHLFLEALAAGKTVGEAAAYSISVLSWQGIFVGDPLYRPFLKSPQAQMSDAMSGKPTRFSQYAFLRAVNLAEKSDNAEEAKKILRNAELFAPGLALNFKLAEKEFAETGACSRRISIRVPELENPGLMLKTAQLFAKAMRDKDALKIYSDLLDQKLIPDSARKAVLKEACELARARGDSSRLAVWYPEFERLSAPPEKKTPPTKK